MTPPARHRPTDGRAPLQPPTAPPTDTPLVRDGAGVQEHRNPAVMGAGRAARTELQEDMSHPHTVWTDPAHAQLSLERLTREYSLHLRGRAGATAPTTVLKYEATLKAFRTSLARHGDPDSLGAVTPFAVNRWVADQRGAELSEHTIASRLSALKVFVHGFVYRYLELTTVDLLRKVPRSQVPATPVQGLSPQEVEQVLDRLEGWTFKDIRNRAFVAVMLATGLRLNEVVQLRLTDLDRVSGELTVLGKGRRTRTVRLSPRALRALREYLRLRPGQVEGDALWLTDTGSKLGYWGAASVFRRLRPKCGIPRLHAHLLRHTFAQTALVKGADRSAVQDMLGHATDAMTRRYSGEVRQRLAAQQMPLVAPI